VVFACFVCLFQVYLVRRNFHGDEFSAYLSGHEGWSVRWQTYLRSSRAGLSLTSGHGCRALSEVGTR
jgi:hypothetical protein